MGIFKKIRKVHGWGYRIGVCGQCGDTVPLEKRTTEGGNTEWLCFVCSEDKRRAPYVKKAKQEEDRQLQDWKELTSIGGRN